MGLFGCHPPIVPQPAPDVGNGHDYATAASAAPARSTREHERDAGGRARNGRKCKHAPLYLTSGSGGRCPPTTRWSGLSSGSARPQREGGVVRSRAVKVRKTGGSLLAKPRFSVGGWYCGEYPIFGSADGPDGLGALHGRELLRLARRIVREFERCAKGCEGGPVVGMLAALGEATRRRPPRGRDRGAAAGVRIVTRDRA